MDARYILPGKGIVKIAQPPNWKAPSRKRNCVIELPDGMLVCRSFRGLRKIRCSDCGNAMPKECRPFEDFIELPLSHRILCSKCYEKFEDNLKRMQQSMKKALVILGKTA